MAIILTRQPQYTRSNISGNVDYLNGSFFTKFVLNIEFRVETFVKPTPDREFLFGDSSFQTDDFITSTGAFTEFNIGDLVQINGCTGITNGNYLISEKIGDTTIRVTDSGGSAVNFGFDVNVNDGVIRSLVEPLAIRYDFGLVENDAPFNYNSPVDGQGQYYDYTHPTQIPTSFQDMTPNGKLSWQVGLSDGCQVKRVSSDNTTGNYVFQVEHTFFIVPFFLPNQLLKLRKSTPEAPNYFDLEKCLKLVYRLRSFATASEPNVFQELEENSKLGDTGWANEIRNGKQAEYSLASISYDTNNIGQAILGDANDITIEINEDAAVAGAYVVLNFIALPQQDEDYKDINSYMYQNYVFDRAEITVGGATVQGETQGTGWQVLTDCAATTASSVTTITATLDFGADAITKINTFSDKRYIIVAEVMGTGQTAGDDNMTPVLCDVNQMGIEIADATIDINTDFLPHNVNNYPSGGSQVAILSRDEVVGNTILKIDKTAFTSCLLDEVTIQIIAKDADEEAVLSERVIDVSGNQVIDGARFVDVSETLAYNVLPTEIRKNVVMIRRTDLDDSTYNVYQVSFPFMFRWEYWQQLILDTLPPDFLDTSADFNGYNHNWDRLGDFSGWNIYYRVLTKLTCDGKQGTITTDKEITHYTYDENTDWTLKEIKLFDDTTELTYAGQYYIKDGINTKVVATFENANSVDFSEYYMEFILSPKEIGDQFTISTFSSVYDRSSISQFTSNDDEGKILVEQVDSTTIKGTAYIDDSKFNKNYGEYTISARINSKITPIPFIGTFDTTETTGSVTASDELLLPLESIGDYDFVVDWGDGNTDTITTWNQAETTHTYSSGGVYTVTILGRCHGWRYNNGGDKNKIITVEQWGNGFRLGDSSAYFKGCSNLTHINAIDSLDLSSTADFKEVFRDCSSLESVNALNWDMSTITELDNMFLNCVSLTFLSCENWDVSNVTDFNTMFSDCHAMIDFRVGSWDMSSATNLLNMFRDCRAVEYVDVFAWNVSNVQSVNSMFLDCGELKSINVSNWDTSSFTDATNLFRNCDELTYLDLSSWDTSSISLMTSMFNGAISLTIDGVEDFNISSLTAAITMFINVTLPTQQYSDLLVNWAAQAPSIQMTVNFHAGSSSNYFIAQAQAARDILTGTYGWTITDGGGI